LKRAPAGALSDQEGHAASASGPYAGLVAALAIGIQPSSVLVGGCGVKPNATNLDGVGMPNVVSVPVQALEDLSQSNYDPEGYAAELFSALSVSRMTLSPAETTISGVAKAAMH
jgi:hypothetical protein